MNDNDETTRPWWRISLIPTFSIGLGVFWFKWGTVGFWWGALYGLFWEIWLGYRFAEWLSAF